MGGEVTFAAVPPPNGWFPIAAVTAGLLFQTRDETLLLWDPASQVEVRTIPGPFPVATWDNTLASCSGLCDQVVLTDLDVDSQTLVEAPEGVVWLDGYGGAFSPDGRFLAVVAVGSLDDEGVGPETPVMVVLINVGEGSAVVIPGTRQMGWDYPAVAWAADGEWVFFANGPDLLAYRPEDATALRVDVELPAHIVMTAG